MSATSCKADNRVAMVPISSNASAAVEPSKQENDTPLETSDLDKKTDFVEILESYQDLNTRLENIAAPLLLHNTELCPKTSRDPGFSVHTILDYPDNLQAVARELLSVSDMISIRTLRKNGPAEKAGLKVGDILREIGSYPVPSGPTARQFYNWVTQKTYANDYVEMSVVRDNMFIDTQVMPQTVCDYPISIFFSPEINGHSDGEAVWITSGLMRSEKSDNNLALIIAHELAHNISGNTPYKSNKARELEADRMALVLMHRAGYNIDIVISEWDDIQHPHSDQQDTSKTHPTLDERYKNFEAESARIKAQIKKGRMPSF